MSKKYNKLVRDLIPDIIASNGDSCVYHIAGAQEYRKKLFEKLKEEVGEVCECRSEGEVLGELADVYEVLDAIMKVEGVNREAVLRVQSDKRVERGGFDKKIILEKTS